MGNSIGTIKSGMYYDGFGSDELIYSHIEAYGDDLSEVCSAETELLFCVRTGDLSGITALSEDEEFISKLLPAGLKNDLLGYSFRVCELITLAGSAAVSSGLSHVLRHRILRDYISRLQDSRSILQSTSIFRRCVYDLTYLTNRYIKSINDRCSPLVRKCVSCIIERMPQKVSLAQLAGELHVSPKYLSSLFNHDMGISLSDFMQDMRVDRAKHLLLYTDLDYPDISNLLCFGSQSYFNQVFRKKTGMTPKQFRAAGIETPFDPALRRQE